MFYDIDLPLLHLLNGSGSALIDQLVLTLTHGVTWIPLYLALFVLVLKNNESSSQIFIIVGCCVLGVLFSAGIDDLLVKPYFGRLRPTHDPMIKHTIDVACGYRGNGYSFYSGHASNTFSVAVYMALLVRSRVFTSFMALWSLLNCYTRLYLGVHYPSDIVCGLFFGSVWGTAAYCLHRYFYYKVSPRIYYISDAYTRTGYAAKDIDMVIAVMLLTVVYAVLKSIITT